MGTINTRRLQVQNESCFVCAEPMPDIESGERCWGVPGRGVAHDGCYVEPIRPIDLLKLPEPPTFLEFTGVLEHTETPVDVVARRELGLDVREIELDRRAAAIDEQEHRLRAGDRLDALYARLRERERDVERRERLLEGRER